MNRATFDEVMVPNYNPQTHIPVKGKGSRVWDQEDNEFIDFTGGIAVNVLGHCHPALVHAIRTQSEKLWHLSNVYTNEPALQLASALVNRTFAEKVYFCNSGSEANEAAFKLARKYAYDHSGSSENEIISFQRSFHGRTLFTVSVGGQKKYCEGFDPIPEGIKHLPFNDIAALEAAMSEKTCAVVLEPIQGEGGVIAADINFLQAVRRLCDQYNALMIFDEIQTGVGRTGELYAYMNSGVVPDILTSAKALGGGFPIGAMLTTTKVAQSLGFGTHGSTYGGNPMACAVARTVLEHVDDDLLKGVKDRHLLFRNSLETINSEYNIFQEIRGQGLLIGCVLADAWKGKGKLFQKHAAEHGLMLLLAGPDVLRIAPALNILEKDIHEGMDRFKAAVGSIISSTGAS